MATIDAVLGAVLLLLPALVLLDAQNLVAGLYPPLEPPDRSSDDFTILVPLFGHPRYFENEAHLTAHKERTALVVNVAEPIMAEFADTKEAEGWSVLRVDAPHRNSPVDMMMLALPRIRTRYVIRLDGDSAPDFDPGRAVAAMEDDGVDVASVKVLPSRRRTLAERMQGVEYDCAMRSRHFRPWLTSGACTIGRTEALRQIMARHSAWFVGEDIETGRIARYLGFRIRHLDVIAYSDAPETFRQLLKQRREWWCGSFRLAIVNLDTSVRLPLWLAYDVVLVWALFSGKLFSTFQTPEVLPAIFLFYTGLTFVVNWPVRSKWMILYPYYAAAQVIIGPPAGVARYVALVVATGQSGRFRTWKRPPPPGREIATDSAEPEVPPLRPRHPSHTGASRT